MHPEKNDTQPGWKTALEKANLATRCGAKTRSLSTCKAPAMLNGRCRIHGGKSPGAPCGQKHGRYTFGLHTKEKLQMRVHIKELVKQSRDIVAHAAKLI